MICLRGTPWLRSPGKEGTTPGTAACPEGRPPTAKRRTHDDDDAMKSTIGRGGGTPVFSRAYHLFEKMVDAHCARDEGGFNVHWLVAFHWVRVRIYIYTYIYV